MLRRLLQGRVHGDTHVTYLGGTSVRRVEYRRRVEWFLDGTPVSEEQAKAYIASREAA